MELRSVVKVTSGQSFPSPREFQTLKAYSITVVKAVYYIVEYYEREIDSASVITCIWYSIQINLIFTIKY